MKEQIIGQVAMVVTALILRWFSPIERPKIVQRSTCDHSFGKLGADERPRSG